MLFRSCDSRGGVIKCFNLHLFLLFSTFIFFIFYFFQHAHPHTLTQTDKIACLKTETACHVCSPHLHLPLRLRFHPTTRLQSHQGMNRPLKFQSPKSIVFAPSFPTKISQKISRDSMNLSSLHPNRKRARMPRSSSWTRPYFSFSVQNYTTTRRCWRFYRV